ncbi:4462_t:CDS:2, partial [Paraglomus occultum]
RPTISSLHSTIQKSYTTLSASTEASVQHCPGCGAQFQSIDTSIPGYIPSINHQKKERQTKAPLDSRPDQQQFLKIYDSLDDSAKKLLYPLGMNFVKPSELKKESTRLLCTRCYNLVHHNKETLEWQETLTTDKSFLKFLRTINNAVVVTVIDLFDFPGSLIEDIDNLVGRQHPHILVANKADLVPSLPSVKQWVVDNIQRHKLGTIDSVHLVSSKKNWNIDELAFTISRHRRVNDNVYLIGCTNVGKSALLNSLLKKCSVSGWKHRVTSSIVPGTTVNMHGLPLSVFGDELGPYSMNDQSGVSNQHLFDTPGIVNENALTHLLNKDELDMVQPRMEINPVTYRLHQGQSMCFGGLGRIDYLSGTHPIYLTTYTNARIHITATHHADVFSRKLTQGQQTILQPPVGSPERLESFPPLATVVDSLPLTGKPKKVAVADIVFSGIGWASVCGGFKEANLRLKSAGGRGVYVRDNPLLPYRWTGKVTKFFG